MDIPVLDNTYMIAAKKCKIFIELMKYILYL